MTDVFINYRRRDTGWVAGRVGDRLRAALGDEAVFLDTLAIEPGVDFVEAIGDHVESCRVLLSLIGPEWTTELNSRSEESNDFVRIEISQALARGVRVVPVLIDDTNMPAQDDLPTELQSLSRLNAVRLSSGSFDTEMSQLVGFLKSHLQMDASSRDPDPEDNIHENTDCSSQPDIGLKHRTEFWKMGKSNKPLYRIFVSLSASHSDIAKVSKVIYKLHPSFRNPVREIIDSRNNFELRTNGWGEFEVTASVYFNDATEPATLRHYITFDQ